jgi:hypothetical protein
MAKHRHVDFNTDKIADAIKIILMGVCTRVDVSKDVKVYECKNVIRVDMKIKEEE